MRMQTDMTTTPCWQLPMGTTKPPKGYHHHHHSHYPKLCSSSVPNAPICCRQQTETSPPTNWIGRSGVTPAGDPYQPPGGSVPVACNGTYAPSTSLSHNDSEQACPHSATTPNPRPSQHHEPRPLGKVRTNDCTSGWTNRHPSELGHPQPKSSSEHYPHNKLG